MSQIRRSQVSRGGCQSYLLAVELLENMSTMVFAMRRARFLRVFTGLHSAFCLVTMPRALYTLGAHLYIFNWIRRRTPIYVYIRAQPACDPLSNSVRVVFWLWGCRVLQISARALT